MKSAIELLLNSISVDKLSTSALGEIVTKTPNPDYAVALLLGQAVLPKISPKVHHEYRNRKVIAELTSYDPWEQRVHFKMEAPAKRTELYFPDTQTIDKNWSLEEAHVNGGVDYYSSKRQEMGKTQSAYFSSEEMSVQTDYMRLSEWENKPVAE